MLNKIETLCSLAGIGGSEEEVRDYILANMKADSFEIDSMGNVIAFKKGKKTSGKKIMICAHMDEVGLTVSRIGDDGLLKFEMVGGIDPRVIIGRRVLVGEKKVNGVVGIKAVHLTTPEERKVMPKTADLYIDVGAETKKSAESKVSLGDSIVFDSVIKHFGDGLLKAKALDDRIGCGIMLELMSSEIPYDAYFVFTVQEEVGLRGATIAVNRVKPDIAIVIEGTTAADIADVADHKKVCKLKNGPVIPFMDGGCIYDKDLIAIAKEVAEENNIKWQTKNLVAGGTDAAVIHKSVGGVKTMAISAPVRYLHSPASVCAKEDIENMYKLISKVMERLG